MGRTLSEKILGKHTDSDVTAGEIAVVNVDLSYVQDGTGPLTVRQMIKMGKESAHDPNRTIFFLDHASPSPRQELSNDHKFLREFANKTGISVSDVGNGISHHVVLEGYASPGDVIVGADSHTCTGGAVGAFATGMGSTDVAVAIALGKTWMMVPETIRVLVTGSLPKGVYSKDIILHLIGTIGSDGATYKTLEFHGDTIGELSVSGRATIANMAVEAGAKAGLFPSDDVTREFLDRVGRGASYSEMSSDEDAEYHSTVEIDARDLEPKIACPHYVDNVKTVGEVGDVQVDQVFIGTSCNGRGEDLRIAAGILKGRKVKEGTRLIVTPASRTVYLRALREGLIDVFVEAGGVVTGPGCGACVGVHEGILADGDVCLATQPRNFKGRMGNPKASIYLGTPALAAATAVKGRITDPREFVV